MKFVRCFLYAGYFKDSLANYRDHVDRGFRERVRECPAEVSNVISGAIFESCTALLQISVGEVDMI